MANYIIRKKRGGEYYFVKPYEGICVKARSADGTWQEHTQVIASGREPFSVYQSPDENIHIVCIDAEKNLVYAVRHGGIWKRHILSKISEEVTVLNMHLYSVRGRLNLLYSALFCDENLLIHCILGDHARPSVAAKLSDSNFFCRKNRIYFTNQDGDLGFLNSDDEKPSFFNRLYKDASAVSIGEYLGKEFLIFVKDSRLFLNGREILSDSEITAPIMVCGADRLYIMWKNGSFIRYISSFNGGSTWSDPMQFINSDMPPEIYTVRNGDSQSLYYGFKNGRSITLLGVSDIFSENTENSNDSI